MKNVVDRIERKIEQMEKEVEHIRERVINRTEKGNQYAVAYWLGVEDIVKRELREWESIYQMILGSIKEVEAW